MKDKTGDFVIEEFLGLKPKMYSFFADDNSGHKKGKALNRNGVATRSHSEYKDLYLNNKCIRHSVNRFQSKNHRIETYEINKISLSCYDEKNIYPNIYPKQWIS